MKKNIRQKSSKNFKDIVLHCKNSSLVDSNLSNPNNQRNAVFQAFKTESKLFESNIIQSNPHEKIGRHLLIKRVENNDS